MMFIRTETQKAEKNNEVYIYKIEKTFKSEFTF